MIVSAAGGAERKIGECDGFFLAWTPDGTGVVFARRRPRERNFELWSVSAKTGEQQRITAPGEFVNGWQQFGYSPDGTTLGYTYWPDKISEAELYIRPASGGTPRRLTSLHSQLSWCWNPDGRSAIVSSEQEGVATPPVPNCGQVTSIRFLSLWTARAMTLSSLRQRRIANGPAGTARLVFERATNEFNLYHYALLPSANGTSTVLGSPEPIAHSTRVTSSPQISPDGKKILFASNRSGFHELWLADVDGSNPRPLTAFASAHRIPGSPRWSPDGTRIVFDVSETRTQLYMISD